MPVGHAIIGLITWIWLLEHFYFSEFGDLSFIFFSCYKIICQFEYENVKGNCNQVVHDITGACKAHGIW